MKYAIIRGGLVDNIIIADQEFANAYYPGAVAMDAGQFVAIGMTWNGQEFAWPEPEPEPEE